MRMVRTTFAFLLLCSFALWAQEPHEAQPGEKHDPAMHQMNMRGDKAMNFSHRLATHHFRLLADGGYVQVEANKADDTATRDAIRTHLQDMEKKFSAGDFSAPEFTHKQTPPGVPAMKKLKAQITYQYEDLPGGARLRMSSQDPKALAAIHEFLKFQIAAHKTGDPETVQAE